jgi:hypothetical protein
MPGICLIKRLNEAVLAKYFSKALIHPINYFLIPINSKPITAPASPTAAVSCSILFRWEMIGQNHYEDKRSQENNQLKSA